MTVNVTWVNDAPQGTSHTVSVLEDGAYTFTAADFGFSDPGDVPANALLAVEITTLPSAGTLTDNGLAVTAGQFVSLADIAAGKLVYTPLAGQSGAAYASFTFQVEDDGGTANGGLNVDPAPRTMTVNVTWVNDAPQGTSHTVSVLEDGAYTFTAADFGFSDPGDSPANALLAVEITTLPSAGTLTDNGLAVTAGQFVSLADIAAGKLVYTPLAGQSGAAYASFTFQVEDDGGTANGGLNVDPAPRTMTVNVTWVNDAPQGTSHTVTVLEDGSYTFTAGDFGFSDPADVPANALLAVEISSLPAAGTLTDNGLAVTAGQFVSAAEIAAGKLVYTPPAGQSGAGYASFTFQVEDDGGTANGGLNVDPAPRTMTVNVTWVNDAPQGTSHTVSVLEDGAYTFTAADFGFSDPGDSPANALLAVEITTLPSAGTLTDNGLAVTAGQFVSLADIAAGKLVYTPLAGQSGAAYASFTFQVEDDGGTANGGLNVDPAPRTMTVNVTWVNDAPQGTSHTVTVLEDGSYTFTAGDFGFSDPADVPANALLAVEISSLPAAGTLTDNGLAVTAGQFVSAAEIAAGKLVYTPPAGQSGAGYASFTFQVEDDGGTANGGLNVDPAPRTMTVNVTWVNDAPQGTSHTVSVLEDGAYTFTAADFGFSDPGDVPANALLAVEITTLPSAGTLTDNGLAVTAGQFVSLADIAAGKLVYTPLAGQSGAAYASFTFQVEDDGGTANGGLNVDPAPRTMTVNVTWVNDAPQGTSHTVTVLEDGSYTFTAGDFGFSDPADVPANALLAVEISSLPAAGTLTDNGLAVTAGQFVSAAEIAAGKLVYTPPAGQSGAGYASFTFQVEDDGGTANGGLNVDPAPRTMTVNVTWVNDAPQGTSHTVSVLEDGAYTFTAADFGFSDPGDSPANALLAVEITTLPSAGTLTDNGLAVTAGQFVSLADIAAGKLVYTPLAGQSGAAYASFTFQVEDDGGTANGGLNVDPAPRTMTVNVTWVNDAPQGTSHTVTVLEDGSYTFTAGDFGFSDPADVPANALLAVEISSLPAAGTLTDNGLAVTAGQFVSAAEIAAGKLVYTPPAGQSGAGYASFTFQVEDDGGTANGGLNVDPAPRTMTVNVTWVNDAPQGTSHTVSVLEDGAYTFTAADFGFSDPGDSPANALLAVEITTLPSAGTLTDNGLAVTAGQFVSLADIAAGKLVYTPLAGQSGAAYASFTFQVEDDGGTANGGLNVDPAPRTMTVNVTWVNDAPQGTSHTVTVLEDGSYTFTAGDFGFSDPADVPANALLAVEISSLPAAGTLTDNGLAVTAGQFVSAAEIAAGKLVYTPPAGQSGAGYASFTFQVEDDGGTANGGLNVDPAPRTMTVNVTWVNDAPQGTSHTVSVLEDGAYTFTAADFGFSDPGDSPANALLAVEITTLPSAGTLTDNGLAVTAGQFVSLADIAAGKLVYTPLAGQSGAAYASFTFQVEDDGGTANGGLNVDPAPRTMTVNVTWVNDAPQGTSHTVTVLEDGSYTFTAGDFGFSDPADVPANALLAVEISSLPAAGTLTDNGLAVTAGQFVSAAEIAAGKLVYTPPAGQSGAGYASFTFQVEDDGGTANGGLNVDPAPRTMTVNVTWVNDAPQGTSHTVSVLEDGAYTFTAADFGFSDPGDSPANALLAVEITTLPSAGTLTDNGLAVTAGQFVSLADIAAGKLVYTPLAGQSGAAYASFTFQVEDDGGTANGGLNVDPAPRTMTVNVTWVNDAPQGTSHTVTVLEDGSYTFTAGDFGFSDPADVPANALLAVEITTLPGAGTLTDNGLAVTAGQFVSAAEIAAGKLLYTPLAGQSGAAYASFTFQVEDDGGTANGGVNVDPAPRTMTVNVTWVNDAPQGTSHTVSLLEDGSYTFTAGDFGFSDPSDVPANALLAVEITSLPAAGTLTDNGLAVTAGQFVSAAEIAAGKLVYTPPAGQSGAGYASFTFQVEDDGGTANGGLNVDPAPRTMTVNVTWVNDAPQGTSHTVSVLEDGAYTFTAADFGFSDPGDSPANALLAVQISSERKAGAQGENGLAVTAGQFVSLADIAAGKLVYTPVAGQSGAAYASFTFQVEDDGGTANGGANVDPTPRTMTRNVTWVNDAPQGTSHTVTVLEDGSYTFTAADFGFSDPGDSPANALLAVQISTLPGAGTLTDNGVAVTAGQFVSLADIAAGKLLYTPVAGQSGAAYASFTFQVEDDGGTANGGLNVDPTPRTMTVNVNLVSAPPTTFIVPGPAIYIAPPPRIFVAPVPTIESLAQLNQQLEDNYRQDLSHTVDGKLG